MHALHVLRIRTVSNSDGLYGAYDPSTALSIRTVTIRTDRTDRTNRNTLCSDVIMRCTLRMCSEYGPLATLTVCTERAIRQLLLTVRNSPTVLDMTERGRRWGRREAGGRLLNKAFLVEASPRGPVPYPYIY